MNAGRLFGTAAAFVAPDPQGTWQKAIKRFLVFSLLCVVEIEVGKWLDVPSTAGWLFGYCWGALTVYGSIKRGTLP